MPMTKQSMWLIIASIATLISVPMIYIGLQNGSDTLATAGIGLFTAGMVVAPAMKIFSRRK